MARVIHIFRQPDRFIAGTVGPLDERVFYVQASEDQRLVSVSLEQQQVELLADRIGALLDEVAARFGADIPDTHSLTVSDNEPLTVPLEEEFRVGTMGLGWDTRAQMVVIELLAMTDDMLTEQVVLEDTDQGPDALRVFLTPAEALAFADRADRVIRAGRALCPLCSRVLEAQGHICVRMNGYLRAWPNLTEF